VGRSGRLLRNVAAVAFAAAAGAAAAEAQLKPWKGKATPPLVRVDLSGNKVDLKNLRGRVVVVNFWATWCEPCKEEMPSLDRLKAKLAGRPLEVLTVNYGEFPEKIAPFIARERITLTVLLDTQKDAARDWKVGGLPMTFIVDAKGRVRHWVFGERDWSGADTVKTIEKLLAEAPGARH
jgi:thiol-disulfide isomerase/thioredoxin